MNKRESLLNSFFSILNNIVNMLVGFVAQTFFIRILGTEFLGLNGLFSNIVSMMGIVELGIGNAIIYNLYKPMYCKDIDQIKSLVHFYKKMYNIIIIIIVILSIIILPFLKLFVSANTLNISIYIVYILFILDVISSYVLSYKRGVLYADKKNYLISVIHICYVVILNVIRVIVLYTTNDYYLYLISKIVMNLLENTVITIVVNNKYKFLKDKKINKLNKSIEKDIFKKVKALFLYKIASFFVTGTDNIIISKYLGLQIVGLYSNYYLIFNSLNTLITQAITSLTSNVGHLLVNNDAEKSYSIFKKIFIGNYWVAVVTSSCLFMIMSTFIKIWLGESYVLSIFVLLVLVLNYFQSIMRSVFTVFKEGAGIYVEDKYIPIIQAILNILLSVVLVKICGLAGIFIGTIISELVWWLYSYPKFIYKGIFKKNLNYYFIMMLKYVCVFLLILLILFIFINIVHVNNLIIEFLFDAIISIIVPNFVLFLIFYNKCEFNYYCNFFKNKIGGNYEKENKG